MPLLLSSYNRRAFLAAGLAFLGSPFLAIYEGPPLHLFAQESGKFGGDEPLCLGLLLVRDLEKHQGFIKKLRDRLHFRTRLVYRSTDKFKLAFASGMLRYFFRDPGLRFAARLINKQQAWSTTSKVVRESEYHYHYKKLITDSVYKQSFSLKLSKHFRTGEDRFLHQYLQTEISNIKSLLVEHVQRDDFLQFANLLTGSICADARGSASENQTKARLRADLRSRLGVSSLLDQSLSARAKFRVRVM